MDHVRTIQPSMYLFSKESTIIVGQQLHIAIYSIPLCTGKFGKNYRVNDDDVNFYHWVLF